MSNHKIEIKGFPVYQNGQDFIIGTAKIQDLLKYTMFTERLVVDFDDNGKPVYSETIQRHVETSRANQIADFLINDETATFPTNIVLGIPLSAIESQFFDNNTVTISFKKEVIEGISKAKCGEDSYDIYVTIIDGQHRIRGIELALERLSKNPDYVGTDGISYKEKLNRLLNMDIVISCFMDKSLEYQAMIFSTINRTQKRVSQDLVYSLFGLTENDSPYKTALEVCLALNGHPKSPFYNRIKLYGNDYDGTFIPPLSQSTMIKRIVSFISVSSRPKTIVLGSVRSSKDTGAQRSFLLESSMPPTMILQYQTVCFTIFHQYNTIFHHFGSMIRNLSQQMFYSQL